MEIFSAGGEALFNCSVSRLRVKMNYPVIAVKPRRRIEDAESFRRQVFRGRSGFGPTLISSSTVSTRPRTVIFSPQRVPSLQSLFYFSR